MADITMTDPRPVVAQPGGDRVAWRIIDEVCGQDLCGELALTTTAFGTTRIYMTGGLVYFAEHDGDNTLAERLVIAGAIDHQQARYGVIHGDEGEDLSRLFERDPSIERMPVELAIELITQITVMDVIDEPVRSFSIAEGRHHRARIDHWFSSRFTIDDERRAPAARARSSQPDTAHNGESR